MNILGNSQQEDFMYPETYGHSEAVTDGTPSHVFSSISEAEETAQALIETMRELECRLSDVLRSDQDVTAKVDGEPHPALVPLAERITSHTGTVRIARQYVISILDRLEL